MATAKKKNRGEAVLVAQDSAAHRSKTAQILEAGGHRVYLATSGNEALEICKIVAMQIDLLVVDVDWSGMPGVELAQVLRALGVRLKVLYTGNSANSAAELGPPPEPQWHYLRKPYGKKALLKAVRTALELRA